MKDIKIYPKDWLQLHPYKQSDPTDLYYTNIANRIYGMLEETNLAYSFEKNEVKQISIRMAAYFEDVISGLNIWRSFITEHKALYGKYLPFYTPDDHYYDDEVNYEDIRFLLWHYTQQYHGLANSTFVGPDNAANGETASLIYQMFCEEWTTAPENERMQQLFAPETRYEDKDKYLNLLYWFHYQSYLFTDSLQELTDTVKEYWEQAKEQNEQYIMAIHKALAHISKSAFLAYTSPKWLSLILPADHPDHSLFVKEGEEAQAFTEPMSEESKKSWPSISKNLRQQQMAKRSFISKQAGILRFPDEGRYRDGRGGRRYCLPEICRLCHSDRRSASPDLRRQVYQRRKQSFLRSERGGKPRYILLHDPAMQTVSAENIGRKRHVSRCTSEEPDRRGTQQGDRS